MIGIDYTDEFIYPMLLNSIDFPVEMQNNGVIGKIIDDHQIINLQEFKKFKKIHNRQGMRLWMRSYFITKQQDQIIPFTFILDSGSPYNLITQQLWNKLEENNLLKYDFKKQTATAKTFNQDLPFQIITDKLKLRLGDVDFNIIGCETMINNKFRSDGKMFECDLEGKT